MLEENGTPTGNQGPATDQYNEPVIDPTKNVLDLVRAETKRTDDLREMESRNLRELMERDAKHFQTVLDLRAEFARDIRDAETARIDAIRAVDVGAVNRAAEVSATQATTLATQVVASAEALRGQVETARQQTATTLAAALEPIQKDIADLRRVQYEQAGSKASVSEGRTDRRGNVGVVVGVVGASLGILSLIVTMIINLSR